MESSAAFVFPVNVQNMKCEIQKGIKVLIVYIAFITSYKLINISERLMDVCYDLIL